MGKKQNAEATPLPTPVMVQEASLGQWLESRIHLLFTEIADGLFGDGYLTREERIGLSNAIGDALAAFVAATETNAPEVYARPRWQEAPAADADMAEAALGEYMALTEAVRRDGTVQMKIIAPGWGSSGYYPAEVLERDGPKVFTTGVKSYWNHATPTEEAERPEGDLNALAAELVSDARWESNHPNGPGLYADAKVFGPYAEAVKELAPHIGVSIRALGRAVQGEAAGRKGPIIQAITAARSVDFVTEPGAGGRIVQMFESVGRGLAPAGNVDQEVEGVGANAELQEAVNRLETENARLREALLLRDAQAVIGAELAGAAVPDVTRARLAKQLEANPPVADGKLDEAALKAAVQEAVSAEVQYLKAAAGYGAGRIEGMGSGQAAPPPAVDNRARMEESFRALGLGESAAKVAANGRL